METNTKGISRKFLTSDLHFSHNKICKYTKRGDYTSTELHDEWLINLWNSQVNPSDLVYHLGDFSFANKENTLAILRQLNGQKFFIKGNHDREDMLDYLLTKGAIVGWDKYKEIDLVESDGTKHKTCLFHFPQLSWHRQHYGSFSAHGHSHGNLQPELIRGRMLDVGLDNAIQSFGKPFLFTEDEVIDWMLNIPLVIAEQHRTEKNPR